MSVKNSFTVDEILQFDRLIFEAHEAFRLVPDFHGFDKPKHHSAAHVGPSLLRLGPLREFWCFSFEAFHQRVKHIAKASNFRNVTKRIMRFWCMQFNVVYGHTHDEKERVRLSNLA